MLLYLKNMDVRRVWLEFWYRKEAFIWIAALLALALSNPGEHHYTLCPFHNIGWSFCPGCGIGRSISCLFHLDVRQSVMMHPLGIPAVLLILFRIYRVLKKSVYITNQ